MYGWYKLGLFCVWGYYFAQANTIPPNGGRVAAEAAASVAKMGFRLSIDFCAKSIPSKVFSVKGAVAEWNLFEGEVFHSV